MYSVSEIEVRYGETDKMGVVYHANYLLYFEVARTQLLRDLGFPYDEFEKQGYMSPVLSVNVEYGSPLTYGDTAFVKTYISASTPTKTTYTYEVYKQGQDMQSDKPCVTGTSTHCAVDAETFRPVSLKRVVPELYEKYQQALVSVTEDAD